MKKQCENCGKDTYCRINGKWVCKSCYEDFKQKQHDIAFNGLKVSEKDAWWNRL